MSGKWSWAILIFVVVFETGCSDKSKPPHGVLPADKMERVVWDMAQAEQYATFYIARDSTKIDRKMETLRLYEAVFRLHHITREEFTKSYRYYLDHPEKDQALFDSVIARGTRARSDMYDRPFYHPGSPGDFPRPGVPIGGRPVGGKYAQGYPGSVGVKYSQSTLGRPLPAAAVKPGLKTPGAAGARAPGQMPSVMPDAIRRIREAEMRRSRDSVTRAKLIKIDSTRSRN